MLRHTRPVTSTQMSRKKGRIDENLNFTGISSVMDPAGRETIGYSWLCIDATATHAVTALDGSDVWESMSIVANDSTL